MPLTTDTKSKKLPARVALENKPEYDCWQNIRHRCHNSNYRDYFRYGGRGIYVCERWRTSFENFLADMGKRPNKMSIGRIDNDGPYSLENCRWETRIQQNNNSRHNHPLTFNGITQNKAAWAVALGISHNALDWRLKNHPVEIALAKPKCDIATFRPCGAKGYLEAAKYQTA